VDFKNINMIDVNNFISNNELNLDDPEVTSIVRDLKAWLHMFNDSHTDVENKEFALKMINKTKDKLRNL